MKCCTRIFQLRHYQNCWKEMQKCSILVIWLLPSKNIELSSYVEKCFILVHVVLWTEKMNFFNMEQRVQGSELCWGYNNMSLFWAVTSRYFFYEMYCVWLHKRDYVWKQINKCVYFPLISDSYCPVTIFFLCKNATSICRHSATVISF